MRIFIYISANTIKLCIKGVFMNKAIISSAAALFFSLSLAANSQVISVAEKGSSHGQGDNPPPSMEIGSQLITILARGGYSPQESTARAGVPSTLRLVTKNTYDCSRALILPSLRVQKILPATGTTDFTIPAQKTGTKFYGICSMGMYAFMITFK